MQTRGRLISWPRPRGASYQNRPIRKTKTPLTVRPKSDPTSVMAMTTQFRTATALICSLVALGTIVAAETPQKAFAGEWQGRTVVIRQRLYSLVFNERGTMGHTYA